MALVWSCLAAVWCLASLVAGAVPAHAHAAYKDSDPEIRETVASAPSEVWVEFTEPPSQGSYLEVFDACGVQVDGGDTQLDGFRMIVSVSGRSGGSYMVRHRAISAVDSHETQGGFAFTVSAGPKCSPAASSDEDAEGNVQGDGRRSGTDSNVWEGIPMGSFFVALALAALIGAAGGRVYAGILGPRA